MTMVLLRIGVIAVLSLSASASDVAQSTSAPWEQYILSPPSRNIRPTSIFATTGQVTRDDSNPLAATLSGNGSSVIFDFGQQVNGYITLQFGEATTAGAKLGVAFSESKEHVGVLSDRATDGQTYDGLINATAAPESSFTFGREYARGLFRYLTLYNGNANASVEVTGVSSYFTASPRTDANKLREYSGYFYCDDDLLNRIWYAGAYTNQLCVILANESRMIPPLDPSITSYGWFNNATITGVDKSAEVFVDAAKRDRTPWAGDYGIAVLTKAISVNMDNLLPVRNALQSLFSTQTSEGRFAYGGPPMATPLEGANVKSDTYHVWTLIALADYAALSGDTVFVKALWNQVLLGFKFILAKVDPVDSLLNITLTNDWGRVGQSGKSIVGNTLLHQALELYSTLAVKLGLNGTSHDGIAFADLALAMKTSVNNQLWDESAGMFYDNTTAKGHMLYPQDGNAMAIRFNMTKTTAQAKAISSQLITRWNQYGAVSLEGLGAISPFVTGFEVDAHLLANPGNSSRAMELIRRQWGFMLNQYSNSTLIEAFFKTASLYYPFYGDDEEAYISHAHAWSTGPMASLSLRVGGLIPTSDAGKTWTFEPHAAGSGLSTVKTGFALPAGRFSVEWETRNKGIFFEAEIVTPYATSGTISVPTFGRPMSTISVSINGKNVIKRGRVTSYVFGVVTSTDDFVTVHRTANGGWFKIVAKEH